MDQPGTISKKNSKLFRSNQKTTPLKFFNSSLKL